MIGYAMLYTIAVSVPLALAALVVSHFLRTHGRPERVVWIFAIAATLLVPALMLSGSAPAPTGTWLPPIQVEVVALSDVPAPAATTTFAARQPFDFDALLLGAWALASLVLAVRWIVSAVRLHRLTGSWVSESIDGVRVWLTSELGPAVTGVIRPRVVLPAWVPALPDRQRALVLLHEQEHLRARDPVLMLVAKLTRIVTPWNPASWLLASGLERAVELDCDRRVLRCHPDVEEYGRTLLAVSARGSNHLLAAAAFAEADVPLRKRILAMTMPPRRLTVRGLAVTIAAGALLMTGAVAVPVPAVRVDAPPSTEGAVASRLPTVGSTSAPRSGGDGDDPPIVIADLALRERVARESAAPEPRASTDVTEEQSLPDPRVFRSRRYPWVDSLFQAEQAASLPNPRVIGDPRYSVLNIYRLADLRAGRNGPGDAVARFPLTEHPDSLFALARAIYGDTLVGIETFMALGGPPPRTDIPPRIRNPEAVLRAMANEYPPELRARGLGGTVGMQFLVGTTGQVQTFRIGQISAYPALDDAAKRVAEVYRFTPAMRGNEPITVWVNHAIRFEPSN